MIIDPAARQRAVERVVAWRRARHCSQAALADRAGVSPGCLRAFEQKTRATQRESVMRIANAIGFSLAALFAPDGRPTRELQVPPSNVVILPPAGKRARRR